MSHQRMRLRNRADSGNKRKLSISTKATLGLAALAAAAQGWALRKTTLVERLLLALAGLFLVFPSLLEALMEAVIGRDIDYTATFGLAIGAAVLLRQRMTLAAPR